MGVSINPEELVLFLIFSIKGNAKARVLPEPVWAFAKMSWPDNPAGIAVEEPKPAPRPLAVVAIPPD